MRNPIHRCTGFGHRPHRRLMLLLIVTLLCGSAPSVVFAQPAPNPAAQTAPAPAPAQSPVNQAPASAPDPSSPPAAPLGASPAMRLDVVGMVLHADIVVQAVMAFLALCSVATWTILIEKSVLLGRVQSLSKRFLTTFRSARTVQEAAQKLDGVTNCPVGHMWQAAKHEWDLFQTAHVDGRVTPHQANGLVQRMSMAATIAQEGEMLKMSRSMGILATIGSTSPFIGLFGTVWGILTSFVGIAASKATSLSAVAPGIAEALLATAIGLVAAIPAVMIYNKFARQIGQVSGMLDNFQGEMTTIVSRELEVVG